MAAASVDETRRTPVSVCEPSFVSDGGESDVAAAVGAVADRVSLPQPAITKAVVAVKVRRSRFMVLVRSLLRVVWVGRWLVRRSVGQGEEVEMTHRPIVRTNGETTTSVRSAATIERFEGRRAPTQRAENGRSTWR
jgi:hypothetical protein